MIPGIDIRYVSDELERLAEEIREAAEDRPGELAADAEQLVGAMGKLLEVLLRTHRRGALEPPPAAGPGDPRKAVTALGDHGIDLLSQLAALARRMNQKKLAQDIEGLTLPLAVWLARCDAEIITLHPVVNAAAALANRLEQPRQLAELFGLLREVGEAVAPAVSQGPLSGDRSHPWRVFLLNRAIVATRSQRPELMIEAFDALTDQLPDAAPDFFREGMEQMDALDYPPEVRSVMEDWFQRWSDRRVLH